MKNPFPGVLVMLCVLTGLQLLAAQTESQSAQVKKETLFTSVNAGGFTPDMLSTTSLHWVSETKRPLLEPRPGAYQNIYAPSILYGKGNWTIYYGAWDGIDTGNDKIYRVTTKDFLQFGPRHTVVENGKYQHVCNVNALDLNGRHLLTCTAYPDVHDRNKPVAISLEASNASETIMATPEHLVKISGYENFENADINGMSVMLYDEGIYRMYFCDFKKFGVVNHAEGTDPANLRYTGVVTTASMAVNDVKIMRTATGEKYYLMGLHMNRSQLYSSISQDPTSFPTPQVIGKSDGDDDRYIVAIGWVVQPDAGGDQLLGMLYGAGAVPSLDKNRIFARWLQKRPVPLDANGKEIPAKYRAEGPGRVYVEVPHSTKVMEWKNATPSDEQK